MRVIDALQAHEPVDQAVGIALAFTLLCRRLNIHPGTAQDVAIRMISEDSEFYPEIKAAKLYITNEL